MQRLDLDKSKNNRKFDPRVVKIVEEMTLFDDDFMKRVFENNIPATELVLKIILNRHELKVDTVEGQVEMHSPKVGGRTIRLDILAHDTDGVPYNIEVQRSNSGASTRRASYISSSLIVRHFKETEGGKKTMCKAVEEYAKEYAMEVAEEAKNEEKNENALRMIESGKLTLEDIAVFTNLPLETVKALASQKRA